MAGNGFCANVLENGRAPEGFAVFYVRQMHFDGRYRNGFDGVSYGVAVVAVGAGVENDAVCFQLERLMNFVDNRALVI